VVLSNAGYGPGVDDIGQHILNPKIALLDAKALKPPVEHTEISVDPKVLDTYMGRYRFPDKDIWTFRRENNRILMTHPTEPEAELFPESERGLFFKSADAQVVFTVDAQGHVTGLVVHSAWTKEQKAKRLE